MAKYTYRSQETGTQRENKKDDVKKRIKEQERKYYHKSNWSRQRGKWGIVRAVMTKNRNKRDATIERPQTLRFERWATYILPYKYGDVP